MAPPSAVTSAVLGFVEHIHQRRLGAFGAQTHGGIDIALQPGRQGLYIEEVFFRDGAGADGDAYFGPDSGDWRGHLGDAYGWMTGLFWNIKDRRTLVWAVNGMPETGRPAARNSALSAPEEALIALALS